MKKIITILCTCLIVLSCAAQYQKKELLFNLKDGNSLYKAENSSGKVGMIDKNGKVIIPFEFFSFVEFADKTNAFIQAKKELSGAIELYTLEGKKFLDAQRGYTRIYSFGMDGIPGYQVEKDSKKGLLDVYFNEILPPVYTDIKYVPANDELKFILTAKELGDKRVYTISSVFDEKGIAYNSLYEGDAIFLTELYPFKLYDSSGNVIKEALDKTKSDKVKVVFFTLSKKGSKGPEDFQPMLKWYAFDNNKPGLSKINNFGFFLDKPLTITDGRSNVTIKENSAYGNDYIKADWSGHSYIEMHLGNEIYYLTPTYDNFLFGSNFNYEWVQKLKEIIRK